MFCVYIFDPRRLLKQSRAVLKNKWLIEGLSVRNKILPKFCSDVHSVPPTSLTSLTTWFPSLADFLFITLLLLSFSFASFVSQDRLHYAWVTKISVSPQCKHLPQSLATWSPLATRRFCARGPWAKQSLLTEWGNALEHMTLQLPQ